MVPMVYTGDEKTTLLNAQKELKKYFEQAGTSERRNLRLFN